MSGKWLFKVEKAKSWVPVEERPGGKKGIISSQSLGVQKAIEKGNVKYRADARRFIDSPH